MKKILFPTVISVLLLSCSITKNDVQILEEQTNVLSNSNILDDSDISPSKNNSQEKVNKIQLENISNKDKSYTFKTRKIKEISYSAKKDSNNYDIFGIINYYDDKGNLKLGANIKVSINSGNETLKSTITDENGKWSILLPKKDFNNKNLEVIFQFENKYWDITDGNKNYVWKVQEIKGLTSDIDTGVITPIKDSESAKVAFIHDIYNRYMKFFKKENVEYESWWKKINTVWPGSSNYYSFGTVNLTDADHWDVNGHEIGYAMTAIGTNSQMGGGQHKIDECYTESLAWSEGFASFLSGVVSLEKNDTDAKFEFLVPRRAPIRLENIPENVCKEITNEWRVSTAMWDLYDTNIDAKDSASIPFKTIFSALGNKNKKVKSIKDAFSYIKELVDENSKKQIDSVFEQNF